MNSLREWWAEPETKRLVGYMSLIAAICVAVLVYRLIVLGEL